MKPEYTPPPLDLTPFRAGTVWHHDGRGYLVVVMDCGEQVKTRATESLSGEVVRVRVRQTGPVKVRFQVERSRWADDQPQEYLLPHVSDREITVGGVVWHVAQHEPLASLMGEPGVPGWVVLELWQVPAVSG